MHPSPSRIFLLLFLLAGALHVQAQDKERLHKALAALKDAKDDTNKVINLDIVGWDTSYENLAAGMRYSEEALQLAEKLHFDRGILRSTNTLGTICADMGDLNKALSYHLRGLALGEKTKNRRAMATSELNISIVYTNMGEYRQSLSYLLRARQHYEAIRDYDGLAVVCNDLGGVYLDLDSVEKAIACFREGMELEQELKQVDGIANSLGGLAKCYDRQGDSLRSDAAMQRAIAIMDSLGNDYERSMLLVNYAYLLAKRGHFRKAETLLKQAQEIYISVGMREQQIELWGGLADIYEKTGQLQKAIDAWKRYSSLKDSVMNENVLRHQRELEAVYENEKKMNEISLLKQGKQIAELDLAKRTAEKNRLTLLISLGGIALLLVIGFAVYIFFSLQQKKRANAALEKAYSVIEESNKNITDSINYARRIQEALLPAPGVLQKQFPDAFVFYRPRDIVSGDFWWCTEKDGKFLLAAADCTGHGVPGGFMSVMSAAFLSEIINEKGTTDPAGVLSLLRLKVISALRQTNDDAFPEIAVKGDTTSVKDGMDIALCSFSPGRIDFACANNPVWIVRNGTLKEFPPDKFPVGIHHNELMPFTPQHEQLQQGDMVYLFSDGYADQFGGEAGKKFKYRQLKELLVSVATLSCGEQHRRVERTFDEWKGQLEQVDDVLVIGIRV